MTTNKTTDIRKQIRHRMVDLGMGMGAQKEIAAALNINPNSLTMALTGYRNGPGSIAMLNKVLEYLTKYSHI